MVTPRKEIDALLEVVSQSNETSNYASQDSEDDGVLKLLQVANTVEHAPQAFARIEGHKDLANGENLVERLAIDIAPQDWLYLDLGHSSFVIKALAHCHISGSDFEANLALTMKAKDENPN